MSSFFPLSLRESSSPTHSPPPLFRPAGRKRGASFDLWPWLTGKPGTVATALARYGPGPQLGLPPRSWFGAGARCAGAARQKYRSVSPTFLANSSPALGTRRARPLRKKIVATAPCFAVAGTRKQNQKLPSFARRGERGAGGYEWGKNCPVGIEEERRSLCPSRWGMKTRLCGGTVK